MKLILRRIAAFVIDYIILGAYVGLTFFISKTTGFDQLTFGALGTQLIAFLTLTLPVFCYFFFMEKSKWKGTVGKKANGIKVDNPSLGNGILTRNILKIIPWEIGHAGVIWAYQYSKDGIEFDVLIWSLWIIPQVIVIVYFVTMLLSKGHQTLYDKIANTSIQNSR